MTGSEQVSVQLDSPEGACHNPMADIHVYGAARCARGAGSRASTSAPGNNDRSRPNAINENDILFKAIANWDSICRFDNITPASLCKVAATTIALSLPISSTQYDGARSNSRADSGAPTNYRKRG